jgi:glycosyltransferase involved in cell wall biosynthesis
VNRDASRTLAVVIPAYNEAATIVDIARRAGRFIKRVIVVDDGSSDATSRVLAALPAVTVLRNPQNLGKGRSLLRGVRLAIEQGAAAVVTLDGDGQHRPEDIPLLLDMASAHPDTIIIAARLHNRHCAPPLRRFANRCADFWISRAAGYCIQDSQSGFRFYPAALLQQCPTASDHFVFESEILIDAAQRGIFSKCVAIDTLYYPNARNSHYRPARDTWEIVRMVTGKLFDRGLHPLGLLRSQGIWPRQSPRETEQLVTPEKAGAQTQH